MNVFMIGGTGLLGCEAAKQLIAHGHKVTSVALPPLPEGAPIPEEMDILFGDINKKSDDEIRELLKGQDVFIFAAGVDERVEFPAPVSDYYYKFNIAPLERILPLCKEAGLKNAVVLGSYFAYLAKKMGVPFGRLICASNRNDVLTEFLACGVYDRNRTFHTTMSPSMDILISSNLERLLFVKFGARRCKALMEQLAATGTYALTHEEMTAIRADFVGYSADEEKTGEAIRLAWEAGYLADPHTAVGYAAIRADRNARDRAQKILLASTASPYKFAANVFRCLSSKEPASDLSALRELSALTSTPIPVPLQGIGERTVRFTGTVAPAEMPARVLEFAGL